MPNPSRVTSTAAIAWILLSLTRPTDAFGGDGAPPLVVDGMRVINGTQLYCKSIGTGIPLVIIHGGPGLDHTYFLPQMEKLAETCELIFFDQRGCGRSSVRLDSTGMTLDSLVEDIDRVRDAYNLEKMNLMGHSWGGFLAMCYALKHGDRLNSLILTNSTPATSALRDSSFRVIAERTSPGDSAEEAAIALTPEFRRRDPAAMKKYFRLLFRSSFSNPRLADSLTLSFGPDYAVRSRLVGYLAKDPQIQHYDLLGRLESITCPVLIIGSDNDLVPPSSNELIHARIRGSRYVVMKNCGHFPFIEAPGQFFPAVTEFLESVRQR